MFKHLYLKSWHKSNIANVDKHIDEHVLEVIKGSGAATISEIKKAYVNITERRVTSQVIEQSIGRLLCANAINIHKVKVYNNRKINAYSSIT